MYDDEKTTDDTDHPFDRAIRALPRYQLSEETKRKHLQMLARLPVRPRPSHKARTAVVLGCVVAFAGAGVGTAAALGAFSAPPTDRSIAHCYATDDPKATGNHFDITVASVVAGRPGTRIALKDAAALAMDICRGSWQQGILSSTTPLVRDEPRPAPWNYPVPPLVACVLDNGQVGIFPGTGATCREMGLPIVQQ